MAKASLDAATVERLMDSFRRSDAEALGSALDEERVPADTRIKGRPLLQAALGFAGGEATATALLERGARVDARDGRGWTALHHAGFSGRADVIRFLLAHGADPRLPERGSGWNVLHCLMAGAEQEFPPQDAAWWDDLLAPLVAAGADPLAADHPPSRALKREIEREIGKDLDDVLPPRDPTTPVALAARLGSGAALERLLALAARRPTVAEASAALRAAVAAGRVESARLLATLGADASQPGADGETPVSMALERRSAPLLRVALEAGGDARAPQGKRGYHPILQAARRGGDPEMLDALLAFGADVHARDEWGHSALSIALDTGPASAVTRLQAAGASEPPSLGIVVEEGEGGGGVVRNVLRGSAADRLDLRPEDRLTSIDDRPIAALADLHRAIAAHRTGETVRLEWDRGGVSLSGSAPLGHRRPLVLPDSPTEGFKFPR